MIVWGCVVSCVSAQFRRENYACDARQRRSAKLEGLFGCNHGKRESASNSACQKENVEQGKTEPRRVGRILNELADEHSVLRLGQGESANTTAGQTLAALS